VAEFDLEATTLLMMMGIPSLGGGGDYLDVGEERGSNFTEEVCKMLERTITTFVDFVNQG